MEGVTGSIPVAPTIQSHQTPDFQPESKQEPVVMGDPVVASWNAADVHVLSKVDTGAAGDPYLD